jgi:hypothetical protein
LNPKIQNHRYLFITMNISIPPYYPLPTVALPPVEVAASNVSVDLADANVDRTDCTIINNSTADLWVCFTGAAAVYGLPSIRVAADGGVISAPANYAGKITGRWEGAAPEYHAYVHQFVYG